MGVWYTPDQVPGAKNGSRAKGAASVFTTTGIPAAESWRHELLERLGAVLGEGLDLGDHRRFKTVWVSCKLFDNEAQVEVGTPPSGTGLSPKGCRTYEDVRKVPAIEAAAEILNVAIPNVLESRAATPGALVPKPFKCREKRSNYWRHQICHREQHH